MSIFKTTNDIPAELPKTVGNHYIISQSTIGMQKQCPKNQSVTYPI